MDILSKPPFSLPKTFRAVDDAIDSNADISEAILNAGLPSFGIESSDGSWKGRATTVDMDKARSTIRQLYRDWSAEGAPERDAVFEPIKNALEKHLSPSSPHQRHTRRILVPGAGLGRLVFELCAVGYTVEGNEISYHQILASNYILNCTEAAGQHTLYPWALNFSNHLNRKNQLRSVAVPDVHPATALQEAQEQTQAGQHFSERMSMSAGDFCVLYRQSEYRGSFDAVTTCFFIDTAPNVINYIETIKHCLKPGGLWTNAGPLLWHFESAPTPAEKEKERQRGRHAHEHVDGGNGHSHSGYEQHHRNGEDTKSEGIGDPGSFELSNDEVVALVQKLGFEILENVERLPEPTGYIQDPESMLINVYRPSFWVARKRG